MSTSEIFHFDTTKQNFDDFGLENGMKFWYAREFMVMLGYEDFSSFKKAINKAMIACDALGIGIENHIISISRELDGKNVPDYKLSRFACYLTAMNGDIKKPEVASAQVYFITLADSVRQSILLSQNVERVLIREDISDRERSLSGTAKLAGIENYAYFQNAGYMGMYNMSLNRLRALKKIPDARTLLDFMGKEELAANLFRITQTEAKIKNENLTGQNKLEKAAKDVGMKVRHTMQEISGTTPEHLPIAEDIREVKKELKQTSKKFLKMDNSKRKQISEPKKSSEN
jgi:DNA-damage-inducible protein D